MENINFFKVKYNALDAFYEFVDKGSEFNIAVEQTFYYCVPLTEIEEIIFVLTIATRYERCQKNASCKFKNYLDKIVLKAEQLNFELYGFNEKEIDIINTDIVEAKAVINR